MCGGKCVCIAVFVSVCVGISFCEYQCVPISVCVPVWLSV